jgi:hypothetical protein
VFGCPASDNQTQLQLDGPIVLDDSIDETSPLSMVGNFVSVSVMALAASLIISASLSKV